MTLETRSGLASDELRPVAEKPARTRARHSLGSAETPAPRGEIRARAGRTNVVRGLREHAARHARDTAFVHLTDSDAPQASLNFAELDRRARVIAAHLQDLRLAGRNIVLAYPPGLEFIAAFFGTLYAGCVAVPAYLPRSRTLDRFDALTSDADAPLVMSTAESCARFETIKRAHAAIPWLATDGLPDAHAERWLEHDPDPDSLAMIQYTSGSTARPKGVMLSHANLVANTRAIGKAFAVGRDTKAVFWLPACHDMGLIGGVLAPVSYGIPNVVIAPAMFVQNPFLWLDTISKFRATVSGGPNFAYDLCVRKVTAEQRASLDLSSWSVAFIGAEAVDPGTLARFTEAFAPCGFRPQSLYPCYGLAEATLMVTGPASGSGAAVRAFRDEALAHGVVAPLAVDTPGARTLVGCGAPVGKLAVAIVVPETRERAAPDRIGEVWVAGESVGQGYWRNPEKTAATFHARLASSPHDEERRFLRTGDLGFMHERELFITGRIDDLMIVRGLNHHPQDIEATARSSHPRLASGLGAAFAFEEGGTQRLVLVHEVAREEDAALNPVIDALRAAVLDEHGLALDAVVLIRCGTILKTSSGKVRRREVAQAFQDGTLPLWREDAEPLPVMSG
jgi:acyl-CoA synthetase (AMP-forming)/AMP-acid ligase II